MHASHTARRLAAIVTATVAVLGGGITLAQGAAAADDPPPANPVDKAILDTAQMVYPTPEGMDYYFSVKERVEGLLGLNDFPDDPRIGAFPGSGVQGMVGDLAGFTPRPPGGRDRDGQSARSHVGPLVLPLCDSPDPCQLTPLVAESKSADQASAVTPAEPAAQPVALPEKETQPRGKHNK